MTTVKFTADELQEMESQTDWQRVDAMTDEEIALAVEGDPDAKLLTEEDFKKMRRRGRQKAPTKDRITIRLDHDIVSYFRDQGQGWQTTVNDILLEYVNSHR